MQEELDNEFMTLGFMERNSSSEDTSSTFNDPKEISDSDINAIVNKAEEFIPGKINSIPNFNSAIENNN